MANAVKLKAGETVIVAAARGDEKPDQGLPTPPGAQPPVDPGYGIDLGLGYLRPSHPIVIPPDGIPTHPIELPPPAPVDPAYGIDADQGYTRPTHPIALPGDPAPKWELKTAWTPTTGWVVVAIPTGEHVTPSAAKRR